MARMRPSQGAENQEVYLTFSPRFERMGGIKETPFRIYGAEAGQFRTPKPVFDSPIRLGEKARHVRNEAHFAELDPVSFGTLDLLDARTAEIESLFLSNV
jgi:hypothetical protein